MAIKIVLALILLAQLLLGVICFVCAAESSKVGLSLTILKYRPTDTINDFDFSSLNNQSLQKLYL